MQVASIRTLLKNRLRSKKGKLVEFVDELNL